MATKYHISPSTGNPNICRAHKRPCPVGGESEHFDSKEAARTAYEKKMEKEFDRPDFPSRSEKAVKSIYGAYRQALKAQRSGTAADRRQRAREIVTERYKLPHRELKAIIKEGDEIAGITHEAPRDYLAEMRGDPNAHFGPSIERDWVLARAATQELEKIENRIKHNERRITILSEAAGLATKVDEAEAKPVESYSGGESHRRGTIRARADEFYKKYQQSMPYEHNWQPPTYPNKDEGSAKELFTKAHEEQRETLKMLSRDRQLREQTLSAKESLEARLEKFTGFKEDPKFGVPTGESTLAAWKDKQVGGYSSKPTKDVPVLKDAKGICSSCGEVLTLEGGTYTPKALHSNGETTCKKEVAEKYQVKTLPHDVSARYHGPCRYCGTSDPAYSQFQQQAYSDETTCGRCGGVSGYGIGD